MSKLYLIRHAEPDYPNGRRMCLGSKVDLPLSARGFEQACELARAFHKIELARVYCSPLTRARQTADELALGRRPVIPLDELTELDGGAWDGLTFCEINARYPDAQLPPPFGESDESGLERAMRALDIISRGGAGDVAAVAHSGLNRILLSAVMNTPQSQRRSIPQECACVNILEYSSGTWRAAECGITLEQWAKRNLCGGGAL